MAVEVSPEQAEEFQRAAVGRPWISGPIWTALWAGFGAAVAYGVLYVGQVEPLQARLSKESRRVQTLEAANAAMGETGARQAKQLEQIPHMQAEIYTLRHAHELLESENERLKWLVKQDARLKAQLPAITQPVQSFAPPPVFARGATGP